MQRTPIDSFHIGEPRKEARELLLFGFACSAVAAAAGAAIVRWPLPLYPGASFTADAWYVLGFKILFMLGGALLWLRWRRYSLANATGPRWRPSAIGWVGVAIGIFAALMINAQHIAPIRDRVAAGVPAAQLGLAVLLPLVAAAIPEELAFRVLLQTRLERVHGRVVAILLSTILFTLWHLPSRFLLASGVEGTAGDVPSILVGTAAPVFVVGLVFAALWDWRRSFVLLVALHYAIDLLPALRHATGDRF